MAALQLLDGEVELQQLPLHLLPVLLQDQRLLHEGDAQLAQRRVVYLQLPEPPLHPADLLEGFVGLGVQLLDLIGMLRQGGPHVCQGGLQLCVPAASRRVQRRHVPLQLAQPGLQALGLGPGRCPHGLLGPEGPLDLGVHIRLDLGERLLQGELLGVHPLLHVLPQLRHPLRILLDLALKFGAELLEVSPGHRALPDSPDGLSVGLHVQRQVSQGLGEAMQALVDAPPGGAEMHLQEGIQVQWQHLLQGCAGNLGLRLIRLHRSGCEVAFQGLPQAREAVCHLVKVILEVLQQAPLLPQDMAQLRSPLARFQGDGPVPRLLQAVTWVLRLRGSRGIVVLAVRARKARAALPGHGSQHLLLDLVHRLVGHAIHDSDSLAVRSPLRAWLLRVDEEFLCFASGYKGHQPGLLVRAPVTSAGVPAGVLSLCRPGPRGPRAGRIRAPAPCGLRRGPQQPQAQGPPEAEQQRQDHPGGGGCTNCC